MIQIHGLLVTLNFLGFLSLFAFSGLVLTKAWLLPSPAFELPGVFARWRQMVNECLGVLTFSAVMLMFTRIAEMDDGTLPKILADWPTVMAKTHFGHVWMLHLATLASLWACCALFTTRLPSRKWAAFMGAGVLLLAFTYSASSHASDRGDFTFAELNDWAHVVSTAVWGGGICISVVLVFPLLQEQHSLASAAAERLSTLAGAALPFALATGVYNSSLQLPDFGALGDTTYGRILAGKLTFVAMMMLIGALNRFIFVPRVRRHAAAAPAGADKPLRLLFHVLVLDASFVLLAIIMAAILVQNEVD